MTRRIDLGVLGTVLAGLAACCPMTGPGACHAATDLPRTAADAPFEASAGLAAEVNSRRLLDPTWRSSGFVLHVKEGEEPRLGGPRRACGSGAAADCYDVVPFDGDATMVEVRPPAIRAGRTRVSSVGAAFGEAYELLRTSGAERVEPLFDQEVIDDAPRTGGRSGGDGPRDPRAADNDRWSLEYVRLPEAWAAVRSATGRLEGAESQGVVIAHPDTGYLDHPELGDAASGPIWPDKGYDYFDDDHDPRDDLSDSRLLDNPAHGTGSASAIVSPTGCQVNGIPKCPTGGGRGARLVPLRVGRSVVHFDTGRITQAILDAAGSQRNRVKVDTDVMSISMGGTPSWALWKAVRRAEEAGYLIIAAAGNYVGTVVWPARFRETIAVAAVNAGCKPWKFTSIGPTVDFSAPGELVWRAEVGEDGAFGTGMGTGTTYATATTAGVAALWIAKHAGSTRFEKVRGDGDTTHVFRNLVRRTAWRPDRPERPAAARCDSDARWLSALQGAGIVDAAALLKARLEDGLGDRRRTAATVQDLPLWVSLYGEEASLELAQEDYRRVFGLAPGEPLEGVAIYEAEILHHYVGSDAVGEAIDLVVSGDQATEAFATVGAALLERDLSPSLRDALSGN
jgi:hypothetical protein